ncbi:MAG: helix-turn-helix transcriptional regulator [Clostridia bacterium]|nr:helix-turn-helix transcriptional regulator [Clostridia bacterium]
MEICSNECSNDICYNEKYYIRSFGTQTFVKKDSINATNKNNWDDYHILLVKSGSCLFEYKDKRCVLDKNSLVICYPGETSKYYWDGTYSESRYICFGGTEIPKLLADCNIHSGVFRCENSIKVLKMFEKLIEACEIAYVRSKNRLVSTEAKCAEIKAVALFVALICEVSESINDVLPNPMVVAQTMDVIRSHYNERISLENIAKSNGISKQALVELFHKETHLTPNKYQRMLQIEMAKTLLLGSNMNVAEIAQRVGFSDPLYFSRIFRNYTSYSPTDYRKFVSSN